MNRFKLARALGWFSIGLGVTEVIAGRPLARLLGLEKHTTLVRVFGAREIAAGIGILTQSEQGPWVWARVAGDVLDLALLGTALRSGNEHRTAAVVATANVAAVTALDVVCGQQFAMN